MFWKITGLGVLAILVFDTLASLASLKFGFPYTNAIIGSILIYITIGYLMFRKGGFFVAIGSALLVQAVDGTFGWYISWQIGPGAMPPENVNITVLITIFVYVLIFAAVCSAIGTAIAFLLHGPQNNA